MPHAYTEDQLVEQPAIGLFAELLAAVKPALAKADQEWSKSASNEAPEFRALSLLSPDENGLSDIMAELLNPRASHGQGDRFLKLFLSRCPSLSRHTISRITVHRESCTVFIANQRRRMDILVDGATWGVGIENKPWAGEQKYQLQDYADDLEKRFGDNFLLIRLAGRDVDVKSMDAARQKQLSAQGKFATWQYAADLLDWLNACEQQSQAPRVTTFLNEFSRYITAEFVSALNPRSDMEQKHLLPALESILAKDPSQLRSAAAIAEVFPTLRQKVVAQLFSEVQHDVLQKLGPGWKSELDDGNFVEKDWAQFGFAHEEWHGLYWIIMESQPKFGLVVLGIWHNHGEGVTRDDQIAQELAQLGWGKKGGGRWWEGHSPLPEPFSDWTTPVGISAVISQRAELKTLLVDEFVKLCTHFKGPLAKLSKPAKSKRS